MNATRPDTSARTLTANASRRSMLAGLSGGGLPGLLAALDPLLTGARKKRKKKKRCCKPNCAGKVCGDDGCGGVCGFTCVQVDQYTTCCSGACKFPSGEPDCCMAAGEFCSPDGGATFGPKYCCSKSCDTGAGHTNLCI